MTGRLRTLTVAKKFWPKRAKAVAEGAIDLGDFIDNFVPGGDLTIDSPTEGSTVDPLTPISGSGARPGNTVELWKIRYDVGKLVHFADATADASGSFSLAGDTPIPEGENTLYAISGIEQSPPVTFTVAAAAQPWDGMTHAQINEWVQHFQQDHDLVLPDGWGTMQLAQKREWLNDNVDPTP